MSTEHVPGFLPSSDPIHWVSDITPNFQGAADANAGAINIVSARTSAQTFTLLKRNDFCITISSMINFVESCVSHFLSHQLSCMVDSSFESASPPFSRSAVNPASRAIPVCASSRAHKKSPNRTRLRLIRAFWFPGRVTSAKYPLLQSALKNLSYFRSSPQAFLKTSQSCSVWTCPDRARNFCLRLPKRW